MAERRKPAIMRWKDGGISVTVTRSYDKNAVIPNAHFRSEVRRETMREVLVRWRNPHESQAEFEMWLRQQSSE